MLSSTILSMVLAATAAYAAPAPAPTESPLVAELLTTVLEVDRISIINGSAPNNEGFIFDFEAKKLAAQKAGTAGLGGQAVTADANAFPFLIGTNVALAVGFMEGCGLNTAHSHKGSEFLVLVDGKQILTQFEFNNKAPVSLELSTFQSTLFPQDSIHTQFNPSCDPITFVSGFDTIDPSVNRAAPGLFGLNAADVEATLGFSLNQDQIEKINKAIPTAFAKGREECLQRCHIKA